MDAHLSHSHSLSRSITYILVKKRFKKIYFITIFGVLWPYFHSLPSLCSPSPWNFLKDSREELIVRLPPFTLDYIRVQTPQLSKQGDDCSFSGVTLWILFRNLNLTHPKSTELSPKIWLDSDLRSCIGQRFRTRWLQSLVWLWLLPTTRSRRNDYFSNFYSDSLLENGQPNLCQPEWSPN